MCEREQVTIHGFTYHTHKEESKWEREQKSRENAEEYAARDCKGLQTERQSRKCIEIRRSFSQLKSWGGEPGNKARIPTTDRGHELLNHPCGTHRYM